jgi:hypothetical protein
LCVTEVGVWLGGGGAVVGVIRIESCVTEGVDGGVWVLRLANLEYGRATDSVSIRGYNGILMNDILAGKLTQ